MKTENDINKETNLKPEPAEVVSGDAHCSACRVDAEKWGSALNEAGWEYIRAFQEITGEELTGRHWNSAKTILRRALLKYFDSLAEDLEPNARLIAAAPHMLNVIQSIAGYHSELFDEKTAWQMRDEAERFLRDFEPNASVPQRDLLRKITIKSIVKKLNNPNPHRRAHHFTGEKIKFPCGLKVELEYFDYAEMEEKTRADGTTFLRFACPHCGAKKKMRIKLKDESEERRMFSSFNNSLQNVSAHPR